MESEATYSMIMKIQKNAESKTNKIRIPKAFIDKFGKQFYMEVFEDKIVLKPIKKKGQ